MQSTEPAPDAPPACRISRRVLIVEDSADIRAVLQLLLQSWGHEVEAAADGLCGVQRALAWRPEVAVVDIDLPLLDGYQVAQHVRAALGAEVFLIALTGGAGPEARMRATLAGFDAFLLKPADLKELSRLVAGTGEGETGGLAEALRLGP
jgi:two-component system, sensor histidine kinase